MLLAVLWRLRYKLGLRDVAELLLQRGFEISHETIRTWEFRFAPMLRDHLRAKRRGQAGRSWYLDETYVKVNGRWCYLYRAIDREGNLLDSMLSARRDQHAARRVPAWPARKRGTAATACDNGQASGVQEVHPLDHRTQGTAPSNQYVNNRMEQSHRPVKQRYHPMLGFGSFESASRFCSAFDELRNYLRITGSSHNRVTAEEKRTVFSARWSTLIAELAP